MRSLVPFAEVAITVSPSETRSTWATRVRGAAAWAEGRRRRMLVTNAMKA
jgi:hypothetical protein